jgi:adenine-specific DNA-methyltransferase
MNARIVPAYEDERVKLFAGDAALVLDEIPDDSVQLIVTSPPYNIGKSYERENPMSLDEYVEWLRPIASKLCDKLTSTGSICWQVGNFVSDGEVYPLDYLFYDLFKSQGLKLRNSIVWTFNFGLHASKRFSGRYETLLWFTKTDEYKFNLDSVRVRQLYPGKRHSKSKGAEKAGRPSGNPKGKNPADFWVFDGAQAFLSDAIWEMPNVKANHPEKTHHPCQFPHELAQRCVLALTAEDDLVLDPFAGAGTSAIAAINVGRRAMAIDKDPHFVELTRERIQRLYEGTLALRPSGISTRRPDLRESVARVPDEWIEAAE